MFISIHNDRCTMKFNPRLNVFASDNYYRDEAGFTCLSEGYYLSSTPTVEEIAAKSYGDFVSVYKGRYVAALWDKNRRYLYVYQDLLAKKFVYYYHQNNCFICATSYYEILDYIKSHQLPCQLDEEGIGQMLQLGRFVDHHTYIKEIKFLRAFEWIEYSSGTLHVNRLPYPQPISQISLEQARDEAYRLFQEAAKCQIKKNERENKRHIVSLSGGMDSRAIFLQLIQNGTADIISYCYAQRNSVDQLVAEQIARDYHTEHIFYPLDGGMFVAQREAMMAQNEGQMYYCGATGMLACMQGVDNTHAGLVHMGIGGGEILGDIISAQTEVPHQEFPKKSYQINLNDIRCCQNSVYTVSDRFECASPFLYEDFFLYLMRLPAQIKQKRRLYVEIYNKYMYNSYETTAFRGKIGKKRSLLSKIFHYVKVELLKKDRFSMNPFAYWWVQNPAFKTYIQSTFELDKRKLKTLGYDTAQLEAICQGDVLAKLRVLTVSAMLLHILSKEQHE